jgi:hypothetical protein
MKLEDKIQLDRIESPVLRELVKALRDKAEAELNGDLHGVSFRDGQVSGYLGAIAALRGGCYALSLMKKAKEIA